MLETDCLIPHHVPIPHREFYALHGDALSVKTLMSEGLGKWAIIKKLRISEETYNDAVYEINKAKAVSEIIEEEEMARGIKLTAETVSRIREMKDNGNTMREIAEECGCGVSTVNHICNGRKSQINEEFDAAVNQMIEESKNEDTKKDTLDTKSDTPNVPDAVMTAVNERINTLSETLSDNLLSIKKMQQENENLRSELAVLYQWKTDNENEG